MSLASYLNEDEQIALLEIDRLVVQIQPSGHYYTLQDSVVPKRLVRIALASNNDYMAEETERQESFFKAVPRLQTLGLLDKDASLSAGDVPQPVDITVDSGARVTICRGYVLGGNMPTHAHVPDDELKKALPLTDPSGFTFLPWDTGKEVCISVFGDDQEEPINASARDYWISWQLTAEGAKTASEIRRIRKQGSSRAQDYPASAEAASSSKDTAVFCKEGQMWRICYNGKQTFLSDCKGLQIIQRLLRYPDPQVPLAATDLQGIDAARITSFGGDEATDKEALEAASRKRERLSCGILDADEKADCATVQKTMEQIEDYEKRSTTPTGRPRLLGKSDPKEAPVRRRRKA